MYGKLTIVKAAPVTISGSFYTPRLQIVKQIQIIQKP